uniref:protein Wnt-10a n=1 Tax=Ciona intestinalis TaxID=7719 RepID=UPI000180BCC4|nr:protein Wnt-10a [Ciona intestinalis]|eukprot:XP_002127850.1 protein Wnt-10a [Ciona intestinalis]
MYDVILTIVITATVQGCFGYQDLFPYRIPTPREPVINSNTVCGNVPGLTIRQSLVCARDPHAVASAIQGMQLAIHECKRQFKNNRWNCSSLETKNKIPHTSSFLRTGYKETAFSYAIASAGVTHQVALACSLGKIDACPCQRPKKSHLTASERRKYAEARRGPSSMEESLEIFHHSGCSHDINFGLQFSTQFLDSRETAHDFMATARLHNNRAGRLTVAGRMRRQCKCFGKSGSCDQKICWDETPDFRMVGKILKKKYDEAVVVGPLNRLNTVRDNSLRLVHEKPSYAAGDLLFFETSPDYCRADPSINILGTSGRYCNATGGRKQQDSCVNLCCGRGYRTYTETRTEKCNCRFHWCCFINCDNCTYTEDIAICN